MMCLKGVGLRLSGLGWSRLSVGSRAAISPEAADPRLYSRAPGLIKNVRSIDPDFRTRKRASRMFPYGWADEKS